MARIGEAPEGKNQSPNRRNGRSQKTVTADSGKVVLTTREIQGHMRKSTASKRPPACL